MSNEPIDDDEEGDISDDPLLSALDNDLSAVSKKTDNRLILYIGVALILVFLPKYVRVPGWAVYTLAVISAFLIFGGIAFTIWSTVQRKKSVAVRYGLQCKKCGQKPKVFRIMQAAELRKCPSCSNPLDVRIPSR
jgi:hypothetical protein